MSVRQDTINLNVNINGNKAQNDFNNLRKKAADLRFEMAGLKKSSEEYIKKSAELKTVTGEMDKLKKSLGLTVLTQRELNQELNKLKALRGSVIPFSKEYKDLSEQIGKVEKRLFNVRNNVQGFNSFTGIKKQALDLGVMAAGALTAGAAIDFLNGSIEEFKQAELATARLQARLNNLGQSDAFPRLKEQADQLAESFSYLDNDEILGVFEQLINYGKLTEKQIGQITPVIIDFAAQQRISVSESASVIIKAMEGNGKALKEYGINIKDAKNESEAFGIIMEQLKPKVEGAAEVFKGTLSGSIARTRQEVKNLQEDIGTKLQPVVLEFYKFISGALDGINVFFSNIGGNLKTLVKEVGASMLRLVPGLEWVSARRNNDLPENTGADKNAVDAEVKRYLDADKEKQQRMLKAFVDQRNQNLEAFDNAVKENNKEKIDLYARLVNTDEAIIAKVNAQKEKSKILGTGNLNDPKKDAEGDKLKSELEQFKKEVEKLRLDMEVNGKTADEQEVLRIEQKYAELLAKAKKYNFAVLELEGFKQKELEAIFKKQFDKRFEENNKAEYEQSLQNNADYFTQLRQQQAVFYNKGYIDKDQYNAAIAKLDRDELNDRLTIATDYSQTVKKAGDDVVQFKKKQEEQITKDLIDEVEKRKKTQGEKLQDNVYIAKRKTLTTRGGSDSNMQAKKELLQAEFDLEMAGKTKRDELYLLKEVELQNALEQIEKEALERRLEHIMQWAGLAADAMSALSNIVKNIEDRNLQRDKKANEKKKDNLKNQLDHKLINQAQYDKKVEELNKQLEEKEKAAKIRQAKRDKALNIFSAIINTGAAIMQTWSKWGFPEGIPFAIAQGVLGAIQVAAIATAPLPELGTGDWIRKGDKHTAKSGGIPAMIERDEAVMSSAAMTDNTPVTVTGTTAQITSALNKRRGGKAWAGGAKIIEMPQWVTDRPAMINSSIPQMMARGGSAVTLSPVEGQTGAELNGLVKQLIAEQRANTEEIKTMKTRLHAVVSIKEYREEEDKYEAAKKAAGLKQ